MKDKVWDLIFSLIDDKHQDLRPTAEDNVAFDLDAGDIVSSIEDIAYAINRMIEDGEL